MNHPTVNKSLKIDDSQNQGGASQPGFFNSSDWNSFDFGQVNTYTQLTSRSNLDTAQRSNNHLTDLDQGSSSARAPSPTMSMTSSTAESSSVAGSSRSRVGKVYKNKDEKLTREAGINFTIDQIVGLPMDEFNDLLSRHELTEEQLNMCRDVRRRGKNKVAAQNCRRRKLDHVDELEIKIQEAKEKSARLEAEDKRKAEEEASKIKELDNVINSVLRQNNYDPSAYTLVRDSRGEIRIEPKVNGQEPHGSLRPEACLAAANLHNFHPYMGYHPPPQVHNYY